MWGAVIGPPSADLQPVGSQAFKTVLVTLNEERSCDLEWPTIIHSHKGALFKFCVFLSFFFFNLKMNLNI